MKKIGLLSLALLAFGCGNAPGQGGSGGAGGAPPFGDGGIIQLCTGDADCATGEVCQRPANFKCPPNALCAPVGVCGPASDAAAPDAGGQCIANEGDHCGGFILNPCQCAPGLQCVLSSVPDVGGTCRRNGGSTDAGVCVQNVLCVRGSAWDPTLCRCVPQADAGTCVQNVLCIRGSAWDPALFRCVPQADAGTCVQNVLCIQGSAWDPTLCRCVPQADAGSGCTTASDCHGILPQICEVCPAQNGGASTTACAHFACENGECVTRICE